MVENVASKAAIAAFWDVLADFVATTIVLTRARTLQLTHQPFLAWHTVLARGSGLRVVRRWQEQQQ
jgi:hypothetical protein